MNRRNFLARVPLTALGLRIAGGAALLGVEGCTVGDAVINILNLMLPAVSGVLPIVALVDPAIGPAVQVAITLFTGGVSAVTDFYHQYEAAVAANGGTAPTLKQEFLSALSTLNTDAQQLLAAARVKDPAHATLIQDIISAVTMEIAQIVSMFTPVASHATAHVIVVTMPSAAHMKAEQAAFKTRMRAILSRQTGDVDLDATTAKLAKSYK
jgi:hypothetical protein